jgi:hypothetical protein
VTGSPTAEEIPPHQPANDMRGTPLLDDPGPEQVAHVRRRRVDRLLLAVEREHVLAAPRVPERPVEAPLQVGRVALEPVGELVVVPDLARQPRRP